MPVPFADTLGDHAIESAADYLILRRADTLEVAAFLGKLSADNIPPYAALLCPLADRQHHAVESSPLALGSYLAARLTVRGYVLEPDLQGCMFALADAVKTVEIIDLVRWRTVLATMPTPRHLARVKERVLYQSRAAMQTLARLSDTNKLRHEHRVLKQLRDDQ